MPRGNLPVPDANGHENSDMTISKPVARCGLLPVSCAGITLVRSGRTLLDNVSLTLNGNGVCCLMGPNGAGKSLLLRVLANLVVPDQGQVSWAKSSPDRARAPGLGFVFQKPVMLRRSAAANIRYALTVVGIKGRERNHIIDRVLDQASLSHLARSPARLLSAGEQQRLAIARAVAVEPEILLLDEPTANLDPTATDAIESLTRDISARGTKIIFVTHDIGQARRLAHEVVFMHAGQVVEAGPCLGSRLQGRGRQPATAGAVHKQGGGRAHS
jgi:tungstate transport system ATP-binding protein